MHALRRSAAQVRNEQRSPGCVARAQGPGGDQVGLGRKLHTHTTSMQIKAMVVVQRGQGGKQAFILARS